MPAFICHLIGRELMVAWRSPLPALTPLVFFIAAAGLFPLAVGPDSMLLARMAPGVIWVLALLATLLGLERLFEADLQDGSLEQLMLATPSPAPVIVAKVCSFWLTAGLPLLLVAPLLGLQFGLGGEALGQLVLSLLLGTPTLSLIGSLAAALTLSVHRTALLALLVLPLAAPVLIFGSAAAAATTPSALEANLSLLGACLLLSGVLVLWAAGAALKLGMESC